MMSAPRLGDGDRRLDRAAHGREPSRQVADQRGPVLRGCGLEGVSDGGHGATPFPFCGLSLGAPPR